MLVLKNVNIFDGINEELMKDAAIVIEGDTIKDIIPGCECPFDNEKVVDLGGRVVSPGFIDCHVHFMLEEIPDKERQMNDQSAGGVLFKNADSYVAFRAVENARKTLEAGFTTVIDGGGVNYVDVALKDAIHLGYVEGPDYYISGKQITAWTSHFRGLGQETYGPWGMRRMVREQLYYGVDQIKIENSAPIRSVGRSLSKSAFTFEEMQAAVDEAHSAGLMVSVHARGAMPIEVAVEAGADLICHGTGISEKGLEMVLERGLYILPTLASPNPEPEPHILNAKSSRVIELLRQTGEIQWDSIRKAYKAGARIALSTDAGGVGIKHGENAKEMLRMKEIGMSNLECLRAATSEAAKAMRLNHVGRIGKGMKADIAILKDNPVENLETVCDVAGVIKNGAMVYYKEM
ncbi:amidohydrolase family protein [Enterocloster sp. OA13]|uniref:Amidohydrolase family protein n=1 Tax=Enterocloster hominis (ex Hitch et al. 2024) TaxID=1917870 RepID=A0ABV1D3Y0_9FIRM|nr:amidohydrolase family protein [Lachnoclostridium pacaense]EEQ56377.1 amidohydrolase family protein [Clostridiales bacterium 1_7_47FAA]MCC2820192.1 amidohydrolase family protein [Lachnoclostridium pacaense]MCH1948858.1 amidohydrolase family protein [Enterocloster sp. OA13]